jgi:hypothetical protein
MPPSISLARPTDDTHSNADDSDRELDTIATMPPPTKVSTSVAARPVSETGPGQSSGRCEPADPAVPPKVQVPASKLMELKAARLARQAERCLQKAQAGLPPSDDEVPRITRPTREELRVLKERSRACREQHRLEQEREAKELEAMEHELMECKTRATGETTTPGGRALSPQAPVAECPPLDNSQLSTCDANSPSTTELEIALATPDLSPEVKKFLGQKRFQNATKMVPSDILTTARRVIYSHYTRVTDIATGITARGTGAHCTQMVLRGSSIISGPR